MLLFQYRIFYIKYSICSLLLVVYHIKQTTTKTRKNSIIWNIFALLFCNRIEVEMDINIYKELREKTETDEKPALTQVELASEFEKNGTAISQSVISKIETSKKRPPSKSVDVLEAYTKYFHVTCDYLLGLSDNKYADENYQMITRTTGLTHESIDVLKKLHNGNMTEDFFNTLNYLISKDFLLFSRFIDAIGMYFDEEYDTPMRFENSTFVPLNDGISDNPILKQDKKNILIGKYDNSLCNNSGGYHTKSIPISILKESYSMYCIQNILEELKRQKGSDN